MEYFIIDNNGQQAGPFSLEQLAKKAITPETLVWKQGMKDWTPAWKVEELKTTLEAAEAIRDNASEKQDFQKAQQAAYQQGVQHGAAMNQQAGYGSDTNQPKKKSNKNLWKIILGLIVFIILVFAITNPGEEAHKEKVRTEVGKAIEKATATTDNNFFSQAMRSVAQMMADNVMDEAMDQLFEYHNYIICSKGTVTFDGKEHSISFGILGKVYTMNADDMVKALEDNDANSDNSDAVDSTSSEDENLGVKVQKKLEDKANQAFDKAADKVSKKVEEKINQKLNEATDSSKIEKIIDKILELL